jgi:hypothetical protein
VTIKEKERKAVNSDKETRAVHLECNAGTVRTASLGRGATKRNKSTGSVTVTVTVTVWCGVVWCGVVWCAVGVGMRRERAAEGEAEEVLKYCAASARREYAEREGPGVGGG